MTPTRILSVGQCGFDHAQIDRLLTRHLGAEVTAADTHAEALAAVASTPFDLVLVNRVGDADGASGLDLIRSLRAETTVPVMLVSNYPDAQAQAVSLGALRGFGKADLGMGKELARIREAFADRE